MSQPQNLFEVTKILYTIIKYLGLFSFRYEKVDFRKARLKKYTPHLIFTSVFYGIITVLVSRIYYAILTEFQVNSLMEKIFFSLYNIIEVITLGLTIVRSKIYNDEVLANLNELSEIEEELRTKINVRFRYSTVKTVLVAITVIYVLFLVIGSALFALTTPPNPKLLERLCWVATFFMVFSSEISTVGMFSSNLAVSIEFLEGINVYIRKDWGVIGADPEDAIKILKQLSPLYRRIFATAKELRRIYGIIVLFQFALTVSVIVLHSYGYFSLYNSRIRQNRAILTVSILMLCLYVGTVGIYIVLGETFSRKVENLKKILFKAFNRAKDQELRNQINALSLQIFHEDYEISAAGFFVVDLRIVTSIISATTMYIIILIQFNPTAGIFEEYTKEASL